MEFQVAMVAFCKRMDSSLLCTFSVICERVNARASGHTARGPIFVPRSQWLLSGVEGVGVQGSAGVLQAGGSPLANASVLLQD